MKNRTSHTCKIENVTRIKNSRAGNPRYRAYVGGFHAITPANNARLTRFFGNYKGQMARVILGTFRGVCMIESAELI